MNRKELLDLVDKSRRTIEFDKEREISSEDWQALLQVAQASPTSNGLEPWRILQIDDVKIREKIHEIAPGDHGQLATAPKFIFISKLKLNAELKRHIMIEMRGYSEEQYQTFDRNFSILQSDLLDIDLEAWQERQSSIVFGRIMLAANLLDIDCCPMEGFYHQKVNEILSEAGIIDLEKEGVAVAVAFGYRKADPLYPKSRRPLEEIISVI